MSCWTKRYCLVYCVFCLTVILQDETLALKINNLNVPAVIPFGQPVVLDCDYILEDSTDNLGLVVKWYFNQNTTPIYQWIPSLRPQDFGILKGRLNLEYSASKDINSAHRALHIIQPGPDLSGDYTCYVSSFNNEDKQTKRMLVFVPEKSLVLRQERVEDASLKVFCSAEGVYPTPNMSLHMGNSEVNGSVITIQERAGLFNIRATANIPALVEPEEFSCELHIPQANYTVRKEAIYYPVSGGGNSISGAYISRVLCGTLMIVRVATLFLSE